MKYIGNIFQGVRGISLAHPLEHQDLVLNLIPDCTGKSILDAGCGKGNWGYLIRSLRNGDRAYMVGVDLSEDYLDFCRRHNVYDELIKADVRNLSFEDESFDLVLACEVIEHLPKEDGWGMLREWKKWPGEELSLPLPTALCTRNL